MMNFKYIEGWKITPYKMSTIQGRHNLPGDLVLWYHLNPPSDGPGTI